MRLPDGSARVYFGADVTGLLFVSAPPDVACQNVTLADDAAAAARPVVIGTAPGGNAAPDPMGRRRLAELVAGMQGRGR